MTARSASMLRGGWRSSSSPTPLRRFVARLFFYRGHRFDPSVGKRRERDRRVGETERVVHAARISAALLLSRSPALSYASAATVGTTHTLSSPSTSLE